ncbi:glycosyltransferase family 2 protein [Kocuria sp. JC486]|uniref:glycosyltransferase family 2 protein n=1 Tax=Kocuria sp. JC486 TaxID=1970736 RepID=UPI001421FBDA|nr:glycosyltransferase family 2 protein [Kocuria sp. JC486]NHU85421.1 glycosyltransferase family 2 protein [Kocuria sp. JC486]
MTTATHVITVCSVDRRGHLLRQLDGVRRWMPEAVHHTVQIGAADFPIRGSSVVDHTGSGDVNLSAARNAGGDAAVEAGADHLVFLDADCVPGPDLGRLYELAVREHPSAVVCGPVTYLPEPAAHTGPVELSDLSRMTSPHPARPNPPTGHLQPATAAEYELFWSLSFAVSANLWKRLRRETGGFCERYTGYGGEDTDFAMLLRQEGIPMVWVGGAHAYHQWHAVSSPPVEHVDAVLRNAELFRQRWGWWPMRGWLEAFTQRGLITWPPPA